MSSLACLYTADYEAFDSFHFPSHETDVKMECYSPEVFRRLRLNYGITDEDYASSLGVTQVLGSFLMGDLGGLSELMSEGKSGESLKRPIHRLNHLTNQPITPSLQGASFTFPQT